MDFDDNSLAAFNQAVEIARHFGGTLILLHVVPLVLSLGEVPPPAGTVRRTGESRSSEVGRHRENRNVPG